MLAEPGHVAHRRPGSRPATPLEPARARPETATAVIHAPGLLAAGQPRPQLGRPAAPGRGPVRLAGDRQLRGSATVVQPALAAGFCLLIAALPFVTAPGDIIADTKLDLAVNPGRFLARALTLWDPQQFGQLQNQAAGYLFPMGPFFALGRLAGAAALGDPAAVDRRRAGVAAFLGTVRLADRLGIGTPWTRIAAGFAYAASPAALTLIGELSAEFLPVAMLPWILIPLAGRGPAAGAGRAPRPGRRSRSRCAAGSTRRRPSRSGPRGPLPAHAAPARAPVRGSCCLVGPGRRCWPPGGGRSRWCCCRSTGSRSSPTPRARPVTTSVDQPVQRAAGHRELGQLPGGERPALVAARLPARHRGAAHAADRARSPASAWPGCSGPRLPARRFLLCLLLAGVLLASAPGT